MNHVFYSIKNQLKISHLQHISPDNNELFRVNNDFFRTTTETADKDAES